MKAPDSKTINFLKSTERGIRGFGTTGITTKPDHGEQLFFKAKLKREGRHIQGSLLQDCLGSSPILREEYANDNQILTK